jgi:uncharacterized protein (TIGR02466 family)
MFAQAVIFNDIGEKVNNKVLLDFAQYKRTTSPSRFFSNKGGFQSEMVEYEEDVQQLIYEIEQHFPEIITAYGLKENVKLAVDSMWININPPYSYNSNHVHPGVFISGSYYIKVPNKSGSLYFVNPSQLQPLFTRQDLIKEYNPLNSLRWNVDPEPGQLLLFPAWIEHGVTQNLSEEDRISIAFNIRIIE